MRRRRRLVTRVTAASVIVGVAASAAASPTRAARLAPGKPGGVLDGLTRAELARGVLGWI